MMARIGAAGYTNRVRRCALARALDIVDQVSSRSGNGVTIDLR